MSLHHTTYEYLKPTEQQMRVMEALRAAAKQYSDALDALLPEGADKTFVLRAHRANAMWANVSVMRYADGRPRPDPVRRDDPYEILAACSPAPEHGE
jgi:hypothetical protein